MGEEEEKKKFLEELQRIGAKDAVRPTLTDPTMSGQEFRRVYGVNANTQLPELEPLPNPVPLRTVDVTGAKDAVRPTLVDPTMTGMEFSRVYGVNANTQLPELEPLPTLDLRQVGIKPAFERIANEQAKAMKDAERYESAGIRPDFERIANEQGAVEAQKVRDELAGLKARAKGAPGATVKTNYDYLQQFTDEYTPKPLTEEEMNRRKRAAHVMSGIGALGNAASAISNLIYTGEGAPSQTLPKNVDASAEIAKLEDDERAKRNEIYQRAKDRVAQEQAREALKYKYAKDARDYQYKYAKDAQDNQYKAAQLKIQLTDLDLKIRKAEREGRLDEVRILTEQWKALKAQQDALDAPALNKARTSNYNSGSAANYARAEYYKNGGSGSRSELEIPYNGGTFQVSKNNWNNMSYLSAVAKDLGVPIQYKRVKDAAGVESETIAMTSEGRTIYLTKGQLQAVIGQALNDPNNAKVKSAVERITKGRILEEEEEAEAVDYIPDESKKKKEEPEEYQ